MVRSCLVKYKSFFLNSWRNDYQGYESIIRENNFDYHPLVQFMKSIFAQDKDKL